MSKLLQRYLGAGNALARLQDHAARLRRLQTVLDGGLPAQFAKACSVVNLKDDVLVIATRGSALAVRLKQMTPSLMDHFLHAGYPLQSIRIKVSTPEETVVQRAPTVRTVSPAAKTQLREFAATLPEDSPLRDALERLARLSRES
ncbi:hypothetical protein CEW87_10145 [Parazoarcus communis]|uniref:RNA-binding protein n=1 Tax=Parazoarcus communis TaxID=41977 RepID=A0A2U8H254_9RHOO|nr:DciA family protein [Parazoarcus communis]AWI79700.1 hypothetical protein CEW87_10145 [Parazoarcus communis]